MNWYRLKKAAAELLFPQRRCVTCGAVAPGEALCPVCRQRGSFYRRCPDCATFIAPQEAEHYRCAACRKDAPYFDGALAARPYEGRLRDLILAYKYHAAVGLRRPFAQLLYGLWQEHWQEQELDLLLPVPLHPNRLQSRGYNQAQLLSELLAKESGLEHRPELLRRVRDTQKLEMLDRRGRMQELSGAFAADAGVSGRRILLIDDVFTTGATTSQAAKALKKAGAASVHVLTLAAGRDFASFGPAQKPF